MEERAGRCFRGPRSEWEGEVFGQGRLLDVREGGGKQHERRSPYVLHRGERRDRRRHLGRGWGIWSVGSVHLRKDVESMFEGGANEYFR